MKLRSILATSFLSFCFIAFILFSCTKTTDTASSTSAVTVSTITALNCSGTTFSGGFTSGDAYSGTATVPYTGGNGEAYATGTPIESAGVTGLSATLQAGTLATGTGNLIYLIKGTPASVGTASFAISFGGQSCSLSLTIAAPGTTDCSTATGVAKIVCLTDALKATLSSTQIATLQLAYTFSNVKTWSNLPAMFAPRLGLKFGDLNATQLAAAKAIVKEMSGTTPNEGWDEVQQIWAADDYLNANGGGTFYGTANYYLAIFGTPATNGTFEIMMSGHHKTVANTYTNGSLVAATPHFAGVEPVSFTVGASTYVPMSQERDAFIAIINSLSTTQLSTALSASTFSDLLLGPGRDWQFPGTSSGLPCSGLTAGQKVLVLNAIKTFVYDISDQDAAKFFAMYSSEIDNTYILYSGTSAMNTRNDYFRIDGPHVWIEFGVNTQNALPTSGVHYHTVWRDKVTDYAGTNN